MSSDVAVATWNLRPTKQEAAESFLDTSPTLPHSGGETSLNGDTRKTVPQAYRQPKGRYYSIVKLQMKYEGQAEDDPSYAMGTGWLIKDDLLVTAGHCAFDHQYGYGRAVEVKAYVGYYGRESVENDKANVQFRHGVAIATTKGWINSDANRANDVSFIRLNRAFRNVVPFKWEATPMTAYSVDLGVVGYPADQKKGDEHGAEMYEMFLESSFDLRSTPSNMLEYQISTYAGQSGSPVFKRDGAKLTPIAAHVYGLGNRNSASVIRGQYGNDFGAHIDALDPKKQFETITTTSSNITYLRVPSRTPEGSFDFQTESFADVLKKVLDVGAKVAPVMLQAGSPFLGLQGNKIASAVSTAIIAANEITKSRTESALKSDLQTIPYKSYAARAVLAEATLQHVLHGPGDDSNMKIYESMKKSMQKDFAKNNVQVKFFANKFGPSLLEPALRIAVVDAAPKTGAEAALIDSYPRIGSRTTVDQLEDPNKKAFVEKLSSQPNAQTAPEGFLDFLCPLASLAVKSIGAVINVINSESASDAPPTPPDSMQAHIEVLCHRALIAEAALQAALEIPVEEHPEGFWSSLVNTVKDISGTVMKVAPSVIKVVTPIVKSLTESSITKPGNTKPGNTKPKTGGRSLKPRPSIADMLRGGVATNDVATDGVDTNDYAADGVDMNDYAPNDPTTDGPTEPPVSYRIKNVSDEMTSMVSAPERQHDGLYFEDIAPPAN